MKCKHKETAQIERHKNVGLDGGLRRLVWQRSGSRTHPQVPIDTRDLQLLHFSQGTSMETLDLSIYLRALSKLFPTGSFWTNCPSSEHLYECACKGMHVNESKGMHFSGNFPRYSRSTVSLKSKIIQSCFGALQNGLWDYDFFGLASFPAPQDLSKFRTSMHCPPRGNLQNCSQNRTFLLRF